ncbi:hypothetical protein MTP04_19680 [Lysinibacillus sp. PLM2]|nr:hypothetical protein MTP04_19680 [Lysinibacillus sp. PLM2]
MAKKGFDLRDINLLQKLVIGDLSFPEYLSKRGLSKFDNFKELKYIVNDNQILLDNFLSKISIGARCRALKGIFELTNKEIEKISSHAESSISNFITENMDYNIDSKKVIQRNNSIDLQFDLSIILDLPFWYLAYSYTKYDMYKTFIEYERPNIKSYEGFTELIKVIDNIYQTSQKPMRSIFGVKIINNYFVAGKMQELYTRVDIRDTYYTVEIHLANKANINFKELKNIESIFGTTNIYIRNAFLRDNPKLIILMNKAKIKNPKITYLQTDFLWTNVLFKLKDSTIKILLDDENATKKK